MRQDYYKVYLINKLGNWNRMGYFQAILLKKYTNCISIAIDWNSTTIYLQVFFRRITRKNQTRIEDGVRKKRIKPNECDTFRTYSWRDLKNWSKFLLLETVRRFTRSRTDCLQENNLKMFTTSIFVKKARELKPKGCDIFRSYSWRNLKIWTHFL